MQIKVDKRAVAKQLQTKINAMQGLGKSSFGSVKSNLTPFNDAFPAGVFPTSAIHEFISYEPAEAASTTGFITALAGKIIKEGGLCLWIGTEKKIFPPALKHFGLEPDRIIFIHPSRYKDALWVIEEAMKCEALTAVVGEIKELGFTESRRLQLAVEHSGITGFIHRHQPRSENAVACTTRWKIAPLSSIVEGSLPGLGYSCWDVQLLKVKNGRPNSWKIKWSGERFTIADPIHRQVSISSIERQAG